MCENQTKSPQQYYILYNDVTLIKHTKPVVARDNKRDSVYICKSVVYRSASCVCVYVTQFLYSRTHVAVHEKNDTHIYERIFHIHSRKYTWPVCRYTNHQAFPPIHAILKQEEHIALSVSASSIHAHRRSLLGRIKCSGSSSTYNMIELLISCIAYVEAVSQKIKINWKS